jgi:hypothetical protein
MLWTRPDQLIRMVVIGLVETVAAVCRHGEGFNCGPEWLPAHAGDRRDKIERRDKIDPRNEIDPRDRIGPLDQISELVDWQLGGGEPKRTERLRMCPNCTEQWHGLAITERMRETRRQGYLDEDYRYCDDDSPVICSGSPPEHTVAARRLVTSPKSYPKAGSLPHSSLVPTAR